MPLPVAMQPRVYSAALRLMRHVFAVALRGGGRSATAAVRAEVLRKAAAPVQPLGDLTPVQRVAHGE
jgi:hypothetical protein